MNRFRPASVLRPLAGAVLLAGLSPLSAAAQDAACPVEGGQSHPLVDDAKAKMVAGDYAGFFAAVAPDLDPSTEQVQTAITGLTELAPDGFADCNAVLQRSEPSGFLQEVVVFGQPGAAMTLYIAAGDLSGQPAIYSFSLSPNFEQSFDKLR